MIRKTHRRLKLSPKKSFLLVLAGALTLLWFTVFLSAPAESIGQEHEEALSTFEDADELALPILHRPGELPVSHRQFLQCLADRLNVDVATRTQRPLVHEETDPLIAFPMMMELADHRVLMCNMTNHIRYVMYVDNGGVPEVGRFLADVEAAFGWTGRVAVRRYPWNAGFSAAVNSAIDWALQLPADEVPFLHVSNNDVRYPPGLCEDRIRDMHQLTSGDNARIKELEAEVAAEAAVQESFAHYRDGKPLRMAWSVNASLVTSALLPERIRYMRYGERRQQLANHTGILFFNRDRDFSSFILSRLAVLTVGYFDENFYPAYFEDIDYYWRADMLGFQVSMTPASRPRFVHLINAMYKITEVIRGGNVAGESRRRQRRYGPRIVALTEWFSRVIGIQPSYSYAMRKWGTTNAENNNGGFGRNAEPFLPYSRFTHPSASRVAEFRRLAEDAVRRQEASRGSAAAGGNVTAADHVWRVESLTKQLREDHLRGMPFQLFNNRSAIPLDAWVRDGDNVRRIQEYGMGLIPASQKHTVGRAYDANHITNLFQPVR